MITREMMEARREEYAAKPLAVQLDRIAANLETIAAGLPNAGSLAEVRDRVDETMAYTEWTGLAVNDVELQVSLLECHRLMGRLRHDWDGVEVSAELRAWVRRDVAAARDRMRQRASDPAA